VLVEVVFSFWVALTFELWGTAQIRFQTDALYLQ
jgi:hypothetical protein